MPTAIFKKNNNNKKAWKTNEPDDKVTGIVASNV